jgi:hypothetical protein
MRLEKMPSTSADTRGGAPHAMSTDRKAVYMAPMCAAPEANM